MALPTRSDLTSLLADDLEQAATPPVDFTRTIDHNVVRGRLAIITGGASGIGLAIAAALAVHGARVAVLDRDARAGEAAVVELQRRRREALGGGDGGGDTGGGSVEEVAAFFACDVTVWAAQAAAFKAALAWAGGAAVDIVVPAAGLGGKSLRKIMASGTAGAGEPVEPPVDVLEVNLKGTYYSTFLALHYFGRGREAEAGSWKPQLLFIASLVSYADDLNPDYTASKHGVRGLWKTLRMSKGDDIGGGAQLNLLAPTFITTPMISHAANYLSSLGLKLGTVDDVVAAAMRCICDPEISSRAVCCCKAEHGQPPGSMNFDLEDDLVTFDGARRLLEHTRKGVFG